MPHSPTCRGCTECDSVIRSAMDTLSHVRSLKLRIAEQHPIRMRTLQRPAVNRADYTPPDSYAPGIATLRAASSTPESRFEDQWKADRLRELEVEHRSLDALAPEARLTAAELAQYAPPDPYAEGIKALQRTLR